MRAGGEEIPARAVVLAAGGYGGGRDLQRRHAPEMLVLEHVGGPGSTGETIEWAHEAGAALAFMDAFQGHSQFVKGFGIRLSPGIPGEGGIFVNANGERFAREDVNYSAFTLDVARQPGAEAVEIFDERVLAAVAGQSMMLVAAERGAYERFAGADELAAHFGLPADRLRATLGEYAEACRTGSDPLGRAALAEPLRPPYYAARIVPALAHTQGGLVVDPERRVLRPTARPCRASSPRGDGRRHLRPRRRRLLLRERSADGDRRRVDRGAHVRDDRPVNEEEERMPKGNGWTALTPSEQEFASAPSWRPEDTTGRKIAELSGNLTQSRANIWRFPPGVKGRRHSHNEQEEAFVVLDGTITMELGEERQRVELPAGSFVVLQPGTQILISNESGGEASMSSRGRRR